MSIKQNITSLQNLLEVVNALPEAGSVELPTLTNEGSASDLFSGKQLIDGDGRVVTGTFSIDNELTTQDNLIAQIQAAVNSLPEAEWSANEDAIVGRNIETYFNDRITKIGSYAFYSCTSLTTVSFPAATTIGTAAFSNCSSLTTAMIPTATNIGWGAFNDCVNLTIISFPKVTSLSGWAFASCSNLSKAIFPACELIYSRAFCDCYNLTTISFPKTRHIHEGAFFRCGRLTTVSFPACTNIGTDAFRHCYNLKSLYLTSSNLCTLTHSNAFSSTPIGGYSTSAGTYGSIYVPQSLLTSYKTATNWTYFSSRFVGI